jgi:hypothetical protein
MKCSNEEKRKILDAAGSKFFQVCFKKKDNSIRNMTCKKWEEKAFTHGSANAKVSSLAHKPEYYLAVDTAIEEFRAINLSTLISCKVNGKEYKFED